MLIWGVTESQSLHGNDVCGFSPALHAQGAAYFTPVKSILRLEERLFPNRGRYRSAPDSLLHLRVNSLIV